jgi:hypothetical protein
MLLTSQGELLLDSCVLIGIISFNQREADKKTLDSFSAHIYIDAISPHKEVLTA